MGKSTGTPKEVTETIEESKSKLIATLAFSGLTTTEIAAKVDMSEYRVSRLMKEPEFKALLKASAEDMIADSANIWKGAMWKLIPKALKVIEKALDEGELEAVKLVMKSVGVEKTEVAPSGGTLQVILPDYKSEKVVTHEIKED